MTEQLYSHLFMRCGKCGDAFDLACHYYDHEEVGTKVELDPEALREWLDEHIENCDAWHGDFDKPPGFTLSHDDGKPF